MSERYKDAGVDIEGIANLGREIKKIAKSTHGPSVVSALGDFSGLLSLIEITGGMEDSVLAFTSDGVGTKPKIASMMSPSRLGGCGEDIVNHCINDTLAIGAAPVAFLDYLAQDELRPNEVQAVLRGMARACSRAGIPILGGETAQMPGIYAKGEGDIVGFMMGVVDRAKIIDGRAIRPYDCLIGLASNGLHTNGYSLARKVFSKEGRLGYEHYWPYFYYKEIGAQLASVLLRPHKSYLEPITAFMKKKIKKTKIDLRGIAHITGGGIAGNLVRILPDGARARINKGSWEIPPIFRLIQKIGNVPEEEMFRVFNMGVGMILAIPPGQCNLAMDYLEILGCEAYEIGRIEKGEKEVIIS